MTGKTNSRERILQCAEAIILQKGFAATSIEDILDKAAITKGGFFYHFAGKTELARGLVERYLENDDQVFADLFAQADNLSEDPLHRLLIFLKLFADMMRQLPATHPGCLVASFTYESQQFDDGIREQVRSGVLRWRKLIRDRLELIRQKYPAGEDIAIDTLADMFTSCIEGGIILSRVLQDNNALAEQVLSYRYYLRLLYEPQGAVQGV